MTDLLLSVPQYLSDEKREMAPTTLERSLKLISTIKRNILYLHGDWANISDKLKDALTRINKTDLSITYCADSVELAADLARFLPEEANIEISVGNDFSPDLLSSLQKFKNVSFFLPLAGITSEIAAYMEQALQLYPAPARVSLGVGWRNRLSGPEPIPTEDHHVWAESLLSLITGISRRNVKLSFYCGLKLCMFNKSQLGQLAVRNITWPIATCPRPFLFSVHGDIAPCVRLPLPASIAQNDIHDLGETAGAVKQWLSPFLGLCYDSENFDCKSLKVSSCLTGCPEHSLADWKS